MSKGYIMTPLKEVLQPVNRPEFVEADKIYNILGAHWYAEGLYTKDIKPGSSIQADRLYRVEEGDFVYNRLFAWKGSFAVATASNHNCYVSNEFPAFKMDQTKVNPNYLWRYFSRTLAWDEALGLSSGGTPTSRNRLKEEKLLAMEIPLPPLEEQRRIVARIEAVAAKIEEARGLRTQTQLETTHLFNSVLHNLFTDNENKWTGVAIDTVAEIIDPNPSHRMPQYSEDGIPFISTIDFDGPETIRKKTAKHVTEDTYQEQKQRCLFAINDILYSRIGTIGEARILTELWPFALSHVLVVVKPKQEVILPRFLLWYLRSDSIVTQAYTATRSIGVPDLGIKRIREFSIPLPTLAEQKKIVMFLDNQQTYITKLKRHQTETSAELNALLPSILDKAFKGEL